jgi:hypothetical protein
VYARICIQLFAVLPSKIFLLGILGFTLLIEQFERAVASRKNEINARKGEHTIRAYRQEPTLSWSMLRSYPVGLFLDVIRKTERHATLSSSTERTSVKSNPEKGVDVESLGWHFLIVVLPDVPIRPLSRTCRSVTPLYHDYWMKSI